MQKQSSRTTSPQASLVSWWDEALGALESRPAAQPLAGLIALSREKREGLLASDDLMRSIVRAVCGQQVSNAVAMKLAGNVLAAAGGARSLDLARSLADLGPQGLASCGLSKGKAAALAALAALYASGEINEAACAAAADDEISERLTAVKGVGPWTAHMILIFGLGRPDVWPGGDYGIKKALAALDMVPGPHEEFAPYRTAAAWLLWRSITQTPVQY